MPTLPLPPLVLDLLPHLPDPARTWLVGGAVRDALLGREVKDVDLTVAEGAFGVARTLAAALDAAFVPLDEARGCARLVLRRSGVVVDVTDFRAATLEADLAGRDFTVNALAVPLVPPHEIVDPLGGLQDLRAGRLRAPSPEVLDDDPLRCLRAVRFAGELGFAIEPETRGWIDARAATLADVSAERIREELLRAISSSRPLTVAEDLEALGLLEALFAERPRGDLETLRRWIAVEGSLPLVKPSEGRNPLEARLDEPLGEAGSRRGLVRLVALLGIPPPEQLRERLERLRLGRSDVRWAIRLVDGFRRLESMAAAPPGPLAIHRFYRTAEDAGPEAALLAFATEAIGSDILGVLLEAWFDRHDELVAPPPLATGDDLLALGLPPGPRIGELLERIREAQVVGEVTTREEALETARRFVARNS